MRLHTLELTAFGPFGGSVTIDFDRLTEGGLFLLHGQTGAGKSSVLDAVCFALYGAVPGLRQQGHRLRSDHAAPNAEPRVVLEFTIQGRRLRVTRSPAWERPKLRGTGTTTQQAKTLVQERCGESWTALSTRNDEAADFITELTGMSREQFCQVVMLPQGQFARFLAATADERAKLLERLFATWRFSDVEQWLAERGRQTAQALTEAGAEVRRVVARAAQAAGTDEPPDQSDEAVRDWLTTVTTAADGHVTTARGRLGQARHDSERRRARLDEARTLRESQDRYAAARRRHLELSAVSADRAAWQTELDAARRAARVAPLLEARAAALRHVDEVTESVAELRTRLAGTLSETAGSTDEESTVRALVAADHDELVRLDLLVDTAKEYALLGEDIERRRAEIESVESTVRDHQAWLAGCEPLLREARDRLDAAASAAARRESDGERLAVARRRRDAARHRDELASELAEARQRALDTTDLSQQAHERWLTLRQRRIDGMAAELAASLRDGEGCPVCGSPDHPAPARATDDQVDSDAERAAQADYEAARRERETARDRLAEISEAHAAARAAAGEESTEVLARLMAEAEAAAEATEAAALDEQQAREAWEALAGEQRERTEALATARVTAAELRTSLADAVEGHDRIGARLDAARGEDADLTSRQARLTRRVRLCEELADQLAERARARRALAEAQARADDSARRAGFEDVDQAAAAQRDDQRAAELETRVREHDNEVARVAGLLEDPDLVAAAAQPEPDLDTLTDEQRQAETELEAATRAEQTAGERRDQLARLSGELDAALARTRPLRRRHEVVERVAGLVNGTGGDNTRRMRLSAYVLAARLERVAEAATERLRVMTGGRYALVHTDERTGGRERRVGLGLRVQDAWTGVERETSTLSGGESFVTSLALALGLADVVREDAGGTALETLFVDEGFGSLDSDTLDEVMDVLDALRDGGRAVGVVSHVADLRARIPARLHVRKSRAGSTIEQR